MTKKKISKVDKLVKYYRENLHSLPVIAEATQYAYDSSNNMYTMKDMLKKQKGIDNMSKFNPFKSIYQVSLDNKLNTLLNSDKYDGSDSPYKILNSKNLPEMKKNLSGITNYLSSDISEINADTEKAISDLMKVSQQLAAEKSKTNVNNATIATLNARIADLQKQIPTSVLQTIGMHPFTHAGAFAAGFGSAKFMDRFNKRVRKKGLDSDTNITGGLFNFGKKQNNEISYLNKRLNKNILSKFMSFDSNDNRVINYNHPLLQKDHELRNMIQDLVNETKNEGKYFTSKRDLAKFRLKINQIEHYILTKYPKFFYNNGSNGETTDLKNTINIDRLQNKETPYDYIPDMSTALHKERSLLSKQLEPDKWRRRLQKWLA